MRPLIFTDDSSQRIYNNYIKRTKRALSSLNNTDKLDTLMEINSHIYEATRRTHSNSEIHQLLNILEKLGDPEIVLKPLVAEKKLDQASRTFNPIHVFKAIILNIGNGISYIIFAFLYILLFGFLFVIGAKAVNPSEVGMFFREGSFDNLGMVSGGYPGEFREVLGHWFIPIMLAVTILLYFFITLLLKYKRNLSLKF